MFFLVMFVDHGVLQQLQNNNLESRITVIVVRGCHINLLSCDAHLFAHMPLRKWRKKKWMDG